MTLLLPPVVCLATAAAMLALHWHLPIAEVLPAPWRWAGWPLLVAGLAMAQWHARLFRRLGTNIDTFKAPGQLTTEGLFGRSRNPMYLGMLLALAGLAAGLGTVSVWLGPAAFFALAQLWYIRVEERAMALKFGPAYQQYRQAVPRWW